MTLLASEFLKQVKPLIEEGIHPQVAVKSFRKAANLVGFFSSSHYDCKLKYISKNINVIESQGQSQSVNRIFMLKPHACKCTLR